MDGDGELINLINENTVIPAIVPIIEVPEKKEHDDENYSDEIRM